MDRNRLFPLRTALLSLCLTAAPLALFGGTEVVQNDSVVDFGQTAIQAGFVAGESAAAWLTPSCSGEIVAVRILWLSLTGGAPDTLGESIRISEAGAFPNPGAQLLELVGPVLTDGFFNEFLIAPGLPVDAGETYVVAFRFLSSPPPLGPSVTTDVDGCQEGRNGIFAIPPSVWFSSCLLGVSGDFAIRAVVNCGESSVLFSDGFETGDTSAWSDVIP